MLAADPAEAQQVQARVVAHPGPATLQPTEPALAGGEHAILTLLYSPPDHYADSHKSLYASRPVNGTRWAQHPIDTAYQHVVDVSVAYDAATGAFLAAAKAGNDVVTCRFQPGPTSGELVPGTWGPVRLDPEMGIVDKPWIIAGSPTLPGGQEYYIVYGLTGKYYLHSTNGGESWHQGPISVDGQNIDGAWGAQPAVHSGGALYVACPSGSRDTIRFFRGEDQADGTVTFSRLLQGTDPDVPLTIPIRDPDCRFQIPGAFPLHSLMFLPYLVADPSDSDNLYVTYQDVDASNSGDVNVYLRKLTKTGNIWTLGPERKVNNDVDPQGQNDQFMPVLGVDDVGRLHVLFYDDRRHEQDDTDGLAMCDAYYAYSVNEGAQWTNRYLYLDDENDPNDPPTLFRQSSEGGHRANPREYNGITWYRYADGIKIFTAYTGTDEEDPDSNDGTIWSSVVEWPESP
jgi:hypothetical protein